MPGFHSPYLECLGSLMMSFRWVDVLISVVLPWIWISCPLSDPMYMFQSTVVP